MAGDLQLTSISIHADILNADFSQLDCVDPTQSRGWTRGPLDIKFCI